jgi:hypothetical protein
MFNKARWNIVVNEGLLYSFTQICCVIQPLPSNDRFSCSTILSLTNMLQYLWLNQRKKKYIFGVGPASLTDKNNFVHKVLKLSLLKEKHNTFSRNYPTFTSAEILNQSRNFMYKSCICGWSNECLLAQQTWQRECICGWPSEYDKKNVSVVSLANTRMAKRTYLVFDQRIQKTNISRFVCERVNGNNSGHTSNVIYNISFSNYRHISTYSSYKQQVLCNIYEYIYRRFQTYVSSLFSKSLCKSIFLICHICPLPPYSSYLAS